MKFSTHPDGILESFGFLPEAVQFVHGAAAGATAAAAAAAELLVMALCCCCCCCFDYSSRCPRGFVWFLRSSL